MSLISIFSPTVLLDVPDATLGEGLLLSVIVVLFAILMSLLPLLVSLLLIVPVIYFHFSEYDEKQKLCFVALQVGLCAFFNIIVTRLIDASLYKSGVSLLLLFILLLPICVYCFVVWRKGRAKELSETEHEKTSLLKGLIKFVLGSLVFSFLFGYLISDTTPLFFLEPSRIFCCYVSIWSIILLAQNPSWITSFTIQYRLYIASILVLLFFLPPIARWATEINFFSGLMFGQEVRYVAAFIAQIMSYAILLQVVKLKFGSKSMN